MGFTPLRATGADAAFAVPFTPRVPGPAINAIRQPMPRPNFGMEVA